MRCELRNADHFQRSLRFQRCWNKENGEMRRDIPVACCLLPVARCPLPVARCHHLLIMNIAISAFRLGSSVTSVSASVSRKTRR